MGAEEEKKAAEEKAAADAEAAKKAAESEGEGEEKKTPDFKEIQTTLKDLREKFVGADAKGKELEEQLKGMKGTAEVVERLKQVLGGKEDETAVEAERKRAEFYKLLVQNPTEAIRQIYRAERAREIAAEREQKTEKDFESFAKKYPEYKEFEEEMKKEMLSNPGWFEKPNFIRRVFFDVLSQKNPELLAKIISENREEGSEHQPFLYEGSSQTLHGDTTSGATIMERMHKVAPEKNYFT
jgi:hypothetical protein